jgi:NTP pyrophosphatase (non-canonical NTP hydrolase)
MNEKEESITLNEYQEQAAETALYPGKGTQQGLTYTVMGLAGEAGEVANKMKKILRGDKPLDDETAQALAKELGGVLWYLAACTGELGMTLHQVGCMNLVQLRERKTHGTIQGDGDDR